MSGFGAFRPLGSQPPPEHSAARGSEPAAAPSPDFAEADDSTELDTPDAEGVEAEPAPSPSMTHLHADRAELELFLAALFRHADENTFISLRVFDQFDRAGNIHGDDLGACLPELDVKTKPFGAMSREFDKAFGPERAFKDETRVFVGHRRLVR